MGTGILNNCKEHLKINIYIYIIIKCAPTEIKNCGIRFLNYYKLNI